MAAAEYYNTSAQAGTPQQSPYHQSPYQRPQELHGSSVPHHTLPQPSYYPQQSPHLPPYQAVQQNGKLSPSPQPSRPSAHSSGRPSFSNQPPPPYQGQHLQAPPHHSPLAQHGSPDHRPLALAQQPHMRPYMNGNPSQYSLNSGYSSDPESRRRRRRKNHEHKHDDQSSRDIRPEKHRSRSTNADGFIGAAGGGLIGDLIFPGLGTVGGAVAGWIGGRDYGKHRKHREEKLHREQEEWEHKFGKRSHSADPRHNHHEHGHHSDNRHSPGYSPRHSGRHSPRHDY